MEIYRIKDEIDSLDLQNVDNLTNNMKTACPSLDNVEVVSYIESSSDPTKDSDDKENISHENSFDRISRRPVESWKYLSLKSDNNRISYKCSLCSSVYQHKKSLNKHWKDKHSVNYSTPSSVASDAPPPSIYARTGLIIYPTESESENILIKNEPTLAQMYFNSDNIEITYPKVNRKRISLQLDDDIENRTENRSVIPQKRLSLIGSVAGNNIPSIFRPSVLKIVNNVVNNSCHYSAGTSEATENILDLRKPNNGALDLRMTTKPMSLTRLCFRCFQCTFRSGTVFELNEHFKMLHMSILIGVKSFQIPVTLYQKLLLNQFNAIVRTECEPMDTFNCRMNCCLCGVIFPTRYDMIQHVGTAHEMEMVWICLVCGFGCCNPIQLSHHFQSHSNIQMLTTPVPVCAWPSPQINPIIPCNSSNSTNNDSQIEKFIPPDFENHLATSTPISANKCKRITSKKDPPVIDSFNSKEKTLKCLVCDATARWRSELFTHMITHSEHRSFGCKFCSYRSKWKWDVPKHLKRCRLAPPHVRKPDVQNSYLITLLQHYSPPPGDILYQFMKEYNIKDIGSLNKSIGVKNETDESFQVPEQTSSCVESEVKSESKNPETDTTYENTYESAYEAISDVTEELDVDVGTDVVTSVKDNSSNCDTALKYTFKRCPWCQDFLTNKPSEMSSHLAQYHGDMDSGSC